MGKVNKIFVSLLVGILGFGLTTIARADDPPKQPSQTPLEPMNQPLPPKGSFEPFALHQVTEIKLDPAEAAITYLELAEDGKSLSPAVPPPPTPPPAKGSFGPGSIIPGYFGNKANSIGAVSAADNLIVSSPINAASVTTILSEGFEGVFPSPGWSRTLDPSWDDVNCFPVETGGSWSGWVAGTTINPCGGTDYPNNMNSWLVYGPFSLANAKSASLDFYFRMISESCCDFFSWGASTNGSIFTFGTQYSGTYLNGPFNNGYNFASLDLTNAPGLGNLTGQPAVWIAFRFTSDSTVTNDGPFIDGITLVKNSDPRTYLTNENFEVLDFPNLLWEQFPANGPYLWDDVFFSSGNCPARSGSWSMWPADEGPLGLDPCAGNPYPNNLNSWLIHGPFNLSGSSRAWIDFYFRNQSELGIDLFAWAVAKADQNFWGFYVTGTQTQGPYGNGYNMIRFDLSQVPGLGDLRGQSEIYLAFIMQTDGSITGQGPFVDDVRVMVERPLSIFLPVIFKPIPGPTMTDLRVTNGTTRNLISFVVQGTPQGTISCSNIPAGSTVKCGVNFTPNTYLTTANTVQCGARTKQKTFQVGLVSVTVTCPSQN